MNENNLSLFTFGSTNQIKNLIVSVVFTTMGLGFFKCFVPIYSEKLFY